MSESPATDDDLTGEPSTPPPGEHDSELAGDHGGSAPGTTQQPENAESSLDQPSQ